MIQPIRAVVFGVGTFGSLMTRVLLDRGVEVVGALARSDSKVGRDLGEVAGLGRKMGVLVERDAAATLTRTEPDVALVAITSLLEDDAPHLRACAEAGVHAVTLSEEAFHPWLTSPALAQELDALARANEITITGSGLQDALWLHLAGNLMATANRIGAVTGRFTWDVEAVGVESARHLGIGSSPERAAAGPRLSVTVFLLHALAARAGLTVEHTTGDFVLEVAEEANPWGKLGTVIEPGQVTGRTDRDIVTTREGIELRFESTGRIFRAGETDEVSWTITGEPELKLRLPDLPAPIATATQAVGRIPDVIAAEPGFVTAERLPPPRYWNLRTGPAPRGFA